MPRHMVHEDQASLTLPPSTCASMRRCPSMRVIGSMTMRSPTAQPSFFPLSESWCMGSFFPLVCRLCWIAWTTPWVVNAAAVAATRPRPTWSAVASSPPAWTRCSPA